jgi:hypothetical protein
MVSGDTLAPVGATQEHYALRAAGGNRIRVGSLDSSRGARRANGPDSGTGGFARTTRQGGVA